MNHGPLIFLGLLLAMGCSWYGFIFKNYIEIGRQEPRVLATGAKYPGGRSGVAVRGQEVYQANGCAACHTMQVRMKERIVSDSRETFRGADIDRGFGQRNTVLRDFVYDPHVFLGAVRLGPDLANAGLRQPDKNWHLIHLYNPRLLAPGSTMPQYPFLFKKQRIKRGSSPNALVFPNQFVPEAGYEIIPTREAEALAEYLLSLQASTPIFEAPVLPPPPPAQTNQPVAMTNQPAAAATNQP